MAVYDELSVSIASYGVQSSDIDDEPQAAV